MFLIDNFSWGTGTLYKNGSRKDGAIMTVPFEVGTRFTPISRSLSDNILNNFATEKYKGIYSA